MSLQAQDYAYAKITLVPAAHQLCWIIATTAASCKSQGTKTQAKPHYKLGDKISTDQQITVPSTGLRIEQRTHVFPGFAVCPTSETRQVSLRYHMHFLSWCKNDCVVSLTFDTYQ